MPGDSMCRPVQCGSIVMYIDDFTCYHEIFGCDPVLEADGVPLQESVPSRLNCSSHCPSKIRPSWPQLGLVRCDS